MKKIRHIIWLHSHFLYWMGGTKYIFEVTKQLRYKGYKIYVIVENSSELAQKQYFNEQISFHSADHLSSNNPFYWIFLPYFLIKHWLYIKRFISQRNLKDVVIVNSMFPMNLISALLKYPTLQLCYEPFAFFYDDEFTSKFSWIKQLFITGIKCFCVPLDKWAVKRQNAVVTLNQTTQQSIKEIYNVSAEPIYAGVDASLFKPYVSTRLKRRYKHKKIIIHSTDYSPVKKTHEMIRMMANVIKQVPDAHLLITSTIEDTKAKNLLMKLAYELGIEKNVEFLGFVPINDLPQYYSLAVAFVQVASSARSGTTSMALPVKEAMCCETPAIRFDVGGEDVVDGKTGFLLSPNDWDGMAKRIIQILNNPTLAKKMGKLARQSISNIYQWEKTADRMSLILSQI